MYQHRGSLATDALASRRITDHFYAAFEIGPNSAGTRLVAVRVPLHGRRRVAACVGGRVCA